MDIIKSDVEEKLKQFGKWKQREQLLICKLIELEKLKEKYKGHSDISGTLSYVEQEQEKIKKELIDIGLETYKIETALEVMPEKLGILLKMRYLENAEWRKIALNINYSEDYVRSDLKNKALRILGSLLD